jgi:hypothetical protein
MNKMKLHIYLSMTMLTLWTLGWICMKIYFAHEEASMNEEKEYIKSLIAFSKELKRVNKLLDDIKKIKNEDSEVEDSEN